MSPTSPSHDVKTTSGFFKNQSRIPATHHYKKLSFVALGLLMVLGAGLLSKNYLMETGNKLLSGSYNFVTQSVCSNTTVTGVPQSECEALVALYNATNGASWTNKDNWLDTTQPIYTWYGVVVNNGHVDRIALRDNNLNGVLPEQLGQLTNLKYLSLGNNRLSGPIPSQIGNLSNLTEIRLASNRLSGPIPTEIGNLSNLEALSIGNNLFSGPIPAEITNLTNLKVLRIQESKISGSIPSEIGNLTNLISLNLADNQLCGKLPKTLTELASTSIIIGNNNIIDQKTQYPDRSALDRGFLKTKGIADDSKILNQIDPKECGTTSLLYSCLGTQPSGTITCSNAPAPNNATTSWTYDAGCAGLACTYTCDTANNYQRNGTACVQQTSPSAYTCQGTLPSNASVCLDGPAPSNTTTEYVFTATCSKQIACDFMCKPGYSRDETTCVQQTNPSIYTCQGSLPSNASLCLDGPTPSNATTSYTHQNICSNQVACDFVCTGGTIRNGTTCVAQTSSCQNQIAINVYKALKSGTTRIITGTASNVASMTFSYVGINGPTTETITISNGMFSKEIIFGPGAEDVVINATPTDPNCSNYSQTITCSTTPPPPTTITCYEDRDNDSYPINNTQIFEATSCPSGRSSTVWTIENNDCNDKNRDIHPGAVEIPDNGIDEDCKDGDQTTQTFSCTGPDPVYAIMCAGDDQNLTADTTKTLAITCSDTKKCEYICDGNKNYEYKNGACVPRSTNTSCGNTDRFEITTASTNVGKNITIPFTIHAKKGSMYSDPYASQEIYIDVYNTTTNSKLYNGYSIIEDTTLAYTPPSYMDISHQNARSYTINFQQTGLYTIKVYDTRCNIEGSLAFTIGESMSTDKYRCDTITKQCVIDPNGSFSSKEYCQASCGTTTPLPDICSNGEGLLKCRTICTDSSLDQPIVGDITTCINMCMCDYGCKDYCGTPTAVCGNRRLESPETCDDGNTTDGDGCSSSCRIEAGICGDGKQDAGEECDFGKEQNGLPGSECSSSCQKKIPTIPPSCTPTPGQETKETSCADTYDNDCDTLIDAKDPDCTNTIPKTCGNYKLDPGEECDDGNNHNNDGCNQYCKNEGGGFGGGGGGTNYCGDGLQRSTEQCDDGNYINGDGCDSNCKLENGKNPTQPPSNRLIVDAIKKMIINLQNNCAYHDKDYYEILQKYKDIRNDDYRDPAVILTTFCITNGYKRKGSLGFNTNQYASIYETIKIITKINAISEGVQFDEKHPDLVRVPYRDVNKGWFTDYVNYAHDLGILDGTTQGKELKGFTPIMTNQLETMLTNVGKDTTPYPVFFKNSKIKRDEMAEIIVDVFKEKFVYAEYMMGENIKFYELVLKQLQGKTPVEQEAFIKNLVERMKNRDKDELETGLNIYLDGVIKFFNAVIATK